MISKETANGIAYAYREVEVGERLLAESKKRVTKILDRDEPPDIRDEFGRVQHGLTLGVPTSGGGHQLFNVPWSLAAQVIEAHIAQQKAVISALSAKARVEAFGELEAHFAQAKVASITLGEKVPREALMVLADLEMGRAAFARGEPISACPLRAASPSRKHWERGWLGVAIKSVAFAVEASIELDRLKQGSSDALTEHEKP